MISKIPLSQSSDYLRPGQVFHFARSVMPKTAPGDPHGHDHFELFWLYHGHATHIVNGTRQKLNEGDIVFIRDTDVHSLRGKGEETHFVNLVILPETVQTLATRYHELSGKFFSMADALPEAYHLNSMELAELSKSARALEQGSRTHLPLEAFLLNLFTTLLRAPESRSAQTMPDWLLSACEAVKDPSLFQHGAAGLVEASGKAHAHVSRVARHYLGQSPSEYVNDIRMEYAAGRLVGGSDTLPEIAQICGVENMSHFHKLFRARHGMTPRAFRMKYQRNVIRPD